MNAVSLLELLNNNAFDEFSKALIQQENRIICPNMIELEAVIQILKNDRAPQKLEITLPPSLEKNSISCLLQIASNKKQELTINLGNSKNFTTLALSIIDAIEKGECPNGLTLFRSGSTIDCTDLSLFKLIKALEHDKCPEGLKLDIFDNDFESSTEEDIHPLIGKAIAETLNSGKCKPNLELLLTYDMLVYLEDALSNSVNLPAGLTLSFSDNNHDGWDAIEDEAADSFASILESGNCPPRFACYFKDGAFNKFHIDRIEHALKRSQTLPRGLTLSFEANLFYAENEEYAAEDIDIALALSNFLISGNAPIDCHLQIKNIDHFGNSNTTLSDRAAKALFTSLESGRCPEGLRLTLDLTTDRQINLLCDALINESCPTHLRIDLNYVHDVDVDQIIGALQHFGCPQGLLITVKDTDATLLDQLNLLLKQNEEKHIALQFALLREGAGQKESSILTKLPDDILGSISLMNARPIKEFSHTFSPNNFFNSVKKKWFLHKAGAYSSSHSMNASQSSSSSQQMKEPQRKRRRCE